MRKTLATKERLGGLLVVLVVVGAAILLLIYLLGAYSPP